MGSPKLNEEKRILREVIVQLQSPTGGCSDGSVEQVFQINTMVGCDGSYSRSSFRDACSSGWHVATASDYFKYGGKTVRPTQTRFVDVTWDSSGKETSLDNWQGYYDSSNTGGWDSLSNSDCIWVSRDEQCTLSFVDHNYGSSYGCHCRGSNSQGVVCVKDSGGCSDGSVEQVFQINIMVGCDGSYSRSSFRDACSSGWHVATASEYFRYGGKTVRPTQTRFVDVT